MLSLDMLAMVLMLLPNVPLVFLSAVLGIIIVELLVCHVSEFSTITKSTASHSAKMWCTSSKVKNKVSEWQ